MASQLLLLLLLDAVCCLPAPGRRRRRRRRRLLLLLLLLWLARSVVLVVREGMGIRKMCARAVRSGFFFYLPTSSPTLGKSIV